jgi:hypothetical protein
VNITEPVISATLNRTNDTISVKLVSDTVSGATPSGATPWKSAQNFYVFQTPADQLPIYRMLHNQREAIDIGYSRLLDPDTRLSVGGYASTELDFTVYSFNAGISRDLFQKNTTVSLAFSHEFANSFPAQGGKPTPMAPTYFPRAGHDNKNTNSLVASVTQVMNRRWLTQFSYEVGFVDGYLNDPYKILSVVNSTTGGPLYYVNESRPRSRTRQSVYWGNKVAIGNMALSLSARAYHDNWGINSITGEISDRIPVTSWLYVEPELRYYHQTAANFFHYYLLGDQPLPKFASADFRLGEFAAVTGGLRFGIKTPMKGEFYVVADQYEQLGKEKQSYAPGYLANASLFAGIRAAKVIVGYTFAF